MPKPRKHVFVCTQARPLGHPRGSCQQNNCAKLYQAFVDQFQQRKLWEAGLQLTSSGCLGPCEQGPSVLIYPEGIMYGRLGVEDVPLIIDQHLLGNTPVDDLQVPSAIWS